MKFLKINDVAEMLSISRQGVYNLMERANFPKGAKFGRSRRWNADEVDEWAQAQTAGN